MAKIASSELFSKKKSNRIPSTLNIIIMAKKLMITVSFKCILLRVVS